MCEGALASSEECAVLAKLNSLLRVEFDRNVITSSVFLYNTRAFLFEPPLFVKAQKSAPSSVIVAELEVRCSFVQSVFVHKHVITIANTTHTLSPSLSLSPSCAVARKERSFRYLKALTKRYGETTIGAA